jgi:transcription-repair coupling factor (superfamily II helicase)
MDRSARALARHNGYTALLDRARDRRICRARRHLDLFPPGMPARPARLLRRHAGIDPHLRSRDAAHRRDMRGLDLVPMSEAQMTSESIRASARATSRNSARRAATTRSMKRSAKAAVIPAWSTGCRCGRTGWTRCSTYLPDAGGASSRRAKMPSANASADQGLLRRAARRRWTSPGGGAIYKPLPPDRALSDRRRVARRLDRCRRGRVDAVRRAGRRRQAWSISARGRAAISRRARRQCRQRVRARGRACEGAAGRCASRVILALWSEGSRERMASM